MATTILKQNNKNLETIWKNINISSLLFLKLFDSEIKATYFNSQSNTKVRLSIHYLAYEYGLLNCYLDADNHKYLYLVFDKEISTSNLRLTTSSYYNFIDRLIDSKSIFNSLKVFPEDNLLVIKMKIPRKYLPGLEHIIRTGKYSELKTVCKPFYDAMINVDSRTPQTANMISNYILTNNLPKGIVTKSESLKKKISTALGVSLSEANEFLQEFFIKFNPDKEYWYEKNLNKYK